AAGMFRLLAATDRTRMADLAARVMRSIGPRLKEHRIGRANLAASFPQKSSAEIEATLREAWDNLGRVAVELAHVGRLRIVDPYVGGDGDITYSADAHRRFFELRDDGKPALIFAAHLGNWELPPLVAARFGLDATVLYRR